MRYPLWLFIFVFVLPPFAAHALLTGKAEINPQKPHLAALSHQTPHHETPAQILPVTYHRF